MKATEKSNPKWTPADSVRAYLRGLERELIVAEGSLDEVDRWMAHDDFEKCSASIKRARRRIDKIIRRLGK